MADPNVRHTDVSLRLRNDFGEAQLLRIEPWCDEFFLAPGEQVEIVANGPPGDSLELEVGEGQIVIYGWTGSMVTVWKDGRIMGFNRAT